MHEIISNDKDLCPYNKKTITPYQNTILIHVSITSKSCISSSKTHQYPLASLLVKRPKPIE